MSAVVAQPARPSALRLMAEPNRNDRRSRSPDRSPPKAALVISPVSPFPSFVIMENTPAYARSTPPRSLIRGASTKPCRSRHQQDQRVSRRIWPEPCGQKRTLCFGNVVGDGEARLCNEPIFGRLRHFIEHMRDLSGSVYGRRLYEVMRYWDDDHPEWDAAEG